MEQMTESYKKKLTGRKPKLNPRTHCMMVRFNDEEYARFMERYRASGVYAKAVFCKSMVFGESFRVFKENEMMRPYNEKLRDYHAKFRSLSTIYNQIVKEMHVNFSERKTMALMQKLEKATQEMSALAKDVITLALTSQQAE